MKMAIIGLPKGSGKIVESQGKVSEKSGNFEVDIEWQPCLRVKTRNSLKLSEGHLTGNWAT